MANPEGLNMAVVGATGQVGGLVLDILTERDHPISHLRAFASERSVGKMIAWQDEEISIEDPETANLEDIDIAIFSAGAKASKNLAPRFVRAGAHVIDNSSAWRMDPEVPLVVSEVNPEALGSIGITANPNCTTMEIMPVVKPLHDEAGLESMIAVTQQAASGAGQGGIRELKTQTHLLADLLDRMAEVIPQIPFITNKFPRPLAFNSIPLRGEMAPGEDETTEEKKLRDESRKILGLPELVVTPLCTSVPVVTGHSVTLLPRFERPLSAARAEEILASAPGVELIDVPTPFDATGRDEVLVGRIREDETAVNGLIMSICGDNLRKGAALNTVQIAELLVPRLLAK